MLLPVLLALAVSAQTDAPAPLPAHECPALFGERELTEDRRASREARLEAVTRSENSLDVVHTEAGWQAPKPTRVPGVEVLAIEQAEAEEEESGPSALVRVSEAWSDACAPGDYRVSIDDGFGSDGIVLAIVDEGVLAEHRGNLIFLPRVGIGAPPVRMIWRSSFALNIAPGSNASAGGASSTPAARRSSNTRATTGRDASAAQRSRANVKAAAENRSAAPRPRR